MNRWLSAALFALTVAFVLPPTAGAQTAQTTTTTTTDGSTSSQTSSSATSGAKTFSEPEVVSAAKDLFGETTEGLAKVVEKVFADMGEPTAYISGSEYSGAIVVGLRYGEGMLNMADGGQSKVFWQGPSLGFDLGGNASKVFVLVYKLNSPDEIYRRIPGVEGSYYFFAGVGVNYQSDGELTLAPIRTGVGLRSGVNIGYLHYGREFSWFPF